MGRKTGILKMAQVCKVNGGSRNTTRRMKERIMTKRKKRRARPLHVCVKKTGKPP